MICIAQKTEEVTSWNSVAASELTIPHFIEETKRKTAVSAHGINQVNVYNRIFSYNDLVFSC
jgi:hypothetical protein